MPSPFMCHECDKPTMNKDGLCDDCKNPTMEVKWVSPHDPGDENDNIKQVNKKNINPLFMWLKKNG